jgi:hypothetical protein
MVIKDTGENLTDLRQKYDTNNQCYELPPRFVQKTYLWWDRSIVLPRCCPTPTHVVKLKPATSKLGAVTGGGVQLRSKNASTIKTYQWYDTLSYIAVEEETPGEHQCIVAPS